MFCLRDFELLLYTHSSLFKDNMRARPCTFSALECATTTDTNGRANEQFVVSERFLLKLLVAKLQLEELRNKKRLNCIHRRHHVHTYAYVLQHTGTSFVASVV